MIREHAANSAWWGAPVGVFEDRSLFDRAFDERALSPYAWVEFRCPLDEAPSPVTLQQNGFMHVDTQVAFRIDLRRLESPPSSAAIEVVFADESPDFRFDDHRPFTEERYLALPGMTQALLDRRYRLWADSLAVEHAAWALEVREGAHVEGWFLAQPKVGTLELTLAMLSNRATISGHALYTHALSAYRGRGATLGNASFSVRNTPVLNLYAALGARFTAAVGHWIRLGESYAPPRAEDA